MERILVPLLAGLLGGAAGSFAALSLAGPAGKTAEPVAESKGLEDLKEQVAEIRRLLDRPTLAPAPAPVAPEDPAAAPSPGASPAAPGGRAVAFTAKDLDAVAEKAAQTVLERQAAAEKAEKAESRKRVTIAEAARELGLSAAQETDLRRAYEEATAKMLKVMAEPETDAESLRRELDAAKDDPAKKSALTIKYMPKFLSKFADVIAIEGERQAKVQAAVGPENARKLQKYRLAEEDPFGLDGDVTIGASVTDK